MCVYVYTEERLFQPRQLGLAGPFSAAPAQLSSPWPIPEDHWNRESMITQLTAAAMPVYKIICLLCNKWW